MSDQDTIVEDAPEAPDTDQETLEVSAPDEQTDEVEDQDFDASRALKKIQKQNRELASLRDRTKKAEEKVSQTAEEKDKEIESLKSQILRTQVGAKTGLPDQIVERLKGDTEEELLADAEQFLEFMSPKRPLQQKPKEALRGGGRPADEPDETDLEKIADRMFGH